MGYGAINFDKKFKLFDEQWKPKVIAEMNDYQFKVVRLQGDFVWHNHKDTDETFIVLEGDLRIDFRDGAVHLSAGEMFVVPKGVEHKPYAEQEVKLLLGCPACRTTQAVDLRTLDRHPWSAISSLIPALSCCSCRPHAPFAELVRLSNKSVAEKLHEQHTRRVLGD
jgi:mannose-6-phosphate isomerase-like protein (cupin superfamily)